MEFLYHLPMNQNMSVLNIYSIISMTKPARIDHMLMSSGLKPTYELAILNAPCNRKSTPNTFLRILEDLSY